MTKKKKRILELEGEVSRLKEIIKTRDDSIHNLLLENGQKENEIKSLRKINFNLADNNKTLVDWVYGIIHKVGIFESSYNGQRITIPIYKGDKIRPAYDDHISPINPGFLHEEEIIIPEIRFLKLD